MLKPLEKVLETPICNSCLGRIYAQLLTGYSNKERGKIIRSFLAFAIDGKIINSENIDPSNFNNFKFRQNKDFAKNFGAGRTSLTHKACFFCDDFFAEKNLNKLAKKISGKLKQYEFKTFLVGNKPSQKLLEKEEDLWEKTGLEFCEPLKAEINREVGKVLEKKLNMRKKSFPRSYEKKNVDLKKPDITILLDLQKNEISLNIQSLYIFGYYNKLIRGIPQCRWGTPGKYKTSIEQIIAKPVMKLSKGKDHSFHGAGREDISAKCFGWRAFVLEIQYPKIRKVNLKKIQAEINKTKKVKVKKLEFSDMETVRKIKSAAPDKTYRAIVQLDKKISMKELKFLNKLKGIIKQKTPERVVHRRADLLRKREVKSIRYKLLNPKKLELIIKGTAGLYIKELISGDNGRTKPSVSELISRKAACKELDVIDIGKI